LAAFAGLAFLGSAASTIYQMLMAFSVTGVTGEAAFTLIFVAISIVLGAIILMYAVREKPRLTPLRRVALIVIGVVALFTWSGLYFGPALAISAGIVPPYAAKKK
jgi:ABC-type Fe3+-siderophore transport system permease subunit